MTLSVHDNLLISYEVHCEKRTITLRTEFRDREPPEFTNLVFEQVEGYDFENDALGNNIIFDVSDVPAEQFLKDYGAELSELHRVTGSPIWAAELGSAPEHLSERGIKPFILSSSLGLSGWILAKKISIIQTERGDPQAHR